MTAVVFVRLLECVAPLIEALLPYVRGETDTQPEWVRTLPAPLHSRVALEVQRARQKLGKP